MLKVVKRLLDTGISLQQIRAAVNHLRDRGTSDLARLTLMSDGVSVYECTSPTRWWTCWRAGRACSGSRSAGSGRRWTGRSPSSRRSLPTTPGEQQADADGASAATSSPGAAPRRTG